MQIQFYKPLELALSFVQSTTGQAYCKSILKRMLVYLPLPGSFAEGTFFHSPGK